VVGNAGRRVRATVMNKKYYDLTMPFTPGMLSYPGDPQLSISPHKNIASGDLYNLSILQFGSHTGTHIDAPKHFYDDGLTVDQLELEYFVGRAKVIEITDPVSVRRQELQQYTIEQGDRILLKTKNSAYLEKGVFDESFCFIDPDAAAYLVEKKIRTVGIDFLSVEKFNPDSPETHFTLLKNNIVIIEGLRLSNVPPGEYEMHILPLVIKGGNGSPARALLSEYEK